jgi:negative regulator of sigma E activity
MLFFGYFSCLIVAFTAVAMWLISTFTHSTLPKQHHPRPPIEQTVMPEEIAPLHLEVTKEASAAKDDVSPVKHHKRRVLARQRDNYNGRGYGNALGYAEETQYGPKRLFSNW